MTRRVLDKLTYLSQGRRRFFPCVRKRRVGSRQFVRILGSGLARKLCIALCRRLLKPRPEDCNEIAASFAHVYVSYVVGISGGTPTRISLSKFLRASFNSRGPAAA